MSGGRRHGGDAEFGSARSPRDVLFALLCCLDGAQGLTLRVLQQHVPDDLETPRDERVALWLDDLLHLEAAGLVDVTSGGIVVRGDPEKGLTDKVVAAEAIGLALDVLTSVLPEKSWLPSSWPDYEQFCATALALITRCDDRGIHTPSQAELALRCTAYLHGRCQYAVAERVAVAARQMTSAAVRADPDDLRAMERLVRAHGHLGRILDAVGAYDVAIKAHGAAVDLGRRVYAGRPFRLAGPLLYQARTLRDLGRFQDAVDALDQAAELLASPFGPADDSDSRTSDGGTSAGGTSVSETVDPARDPRAVEEVFRLRVSQGRLLLDLGQVQQGIDLLRELQLGDHGQPMRWLGDEALQFDQARVLSARGQMERDLGQYTDAASTLQAALRLNRAHFGANHIVVARTLDQLARVHRDQGRYQHALNEYQRSLTIKTEHLTEGHPEVARTNVALAGVMRRLGELAPAVEAADAGLAALEQHFGLHPEVVQALLTRAAVARDAGDPVTARSMVARAEALLAQMPQPRPEMGHLSHPLAAVAYLILASLDRADGFLAAALRHAQWALAIDEALYPSEHAETARPLVERGRIHRRLGELDRADEDLLAAERILVWGFQGLHPEIARIKGHRARILRSLDDPHGARRAMEELDRARLMTRSLLGAGHVDVSALTAEYGRGLLAGGRPLAALAVLEESLVAEEAAWGPLADHSIEVAITYASLGEVHAVLGAEAECRRTLERALEIKRTIYGDRHNLVARALRDYARGLQTLHPVPSAVEAGEVLMLLRDALAIAVEVDTEGIEGVLPAAMALAEAASAFGDDPATAGVVSDRDRPWAVEALEDGLARVATTFTGAAALSPGNRRVAAAVAMLDRLRGGE